MRSPQPSSEDSLSHVASKVNRRVRFTANDKFKVNLKEIKKQHRQSRYIKEHQLPIVSPQESQDLKQSFYFRVKVISKIGMFIQKLKGLVALSSPNFKYNEMSYIETQISDDNSQKLLFSSQNKPVFLFEVVLLFMSLISIWNVSFLVIFPTEYLLPYQLRMTMLALFALEIVVNLFLMPLSTIKVESKMDHQYVMAHYLKNNFIFDAISLVSLVIIQYVNSQHNILYIFKFLAILKVFTVLRVAKKIDVMFVTTPESESKISIIKLIMKILTFVHILSLTLNMLHQVENTHGVKQTWLKRYGMSQARPFQMYLCGWYWGATILTTVGFGDIVPANIYEAFVISIIQITCCAIFGYSINYIGGLIGVLGESTQLFDKQMRRVNQYVQNLDVNKSLKNEIRQHFYNKQKIKKKYDPVAESMVLDSIPVPMKNEVLSTSNKNVLKAIPFFKRYNDNILNKLAMKLKRTIYSPEEVVFKKEDSKIKMWILEKGNIKEYYNNEPGNIQKMIAEYDTTTVQPGYINFITGEPFTTYGRSERFSWTYEISREDMLTVLRSFKAQYHQFLQLKDSLIQKGKKFVSKCCACLKLNHNALECPRIHFQARIKLYKLANLSRIHANQRHFYPRSPEKYKTLSLFSLMMDEESQNLNSIYIHNSKRTSMNDLNSLHEHKRSSKRMSTLFSEGMPKFGFKDTTLHQEEKPLKIQPDIPKLEFSQPHKQEQLKLWLDQCKFSDSESYFPENHVSKILREYNRKVTQIVKTRLPPLI